MNVFLFLKIKLDVDINYQKNAWGKTKFRPSWCAEKDGKGDLLNSWCSSSVTSSYAGYCKYVRKTLL